MEDLGGGYFCHSNALYAGEISIFGRVIAASMTSNQSRMRKFGWGMGATLLVSSCCMLPPASDLNSRPFEVDVMPRILTVGEYVHVSYQFLGKKDKRYRILFGEIETAPETMLELAEPTTDPGTYSFVLESKMVDRRDPTRIIEVVPGRQYAVGFVGYMEGKEFGGNIAYLPVQGAR